NLILSFGNGMIITSKIVYTCRFFWFLEVRVNNFDPNLLFGLSGMTVKPSTATVFGNDRPKNKRIFFY
ncbi:MAG: hypothetical protein IIY75_08565, partial [Erysipelotrichales bacterium]|nr:hypothetical protein [Erysipelotrichales bacterium]